MSWTFWQHVEPRGDCWIWRGPVHNSGYGRVTVGHGHRELAHRMAWRLAGLGEPGLFEVCHICDVQLCVRPDHLFLGTQADNIRDMVKKGRAATGEKNGACKLTDEQVAEIRKLSTGAWGEQRRFAKQFGVSQPQISLILRGRSR